MIAHAPPPRNGWIRAVRQALGMSQPQLAARLKLKRQSLNDLEKAEAAGKITLESLRRVARALECTLTYALVPTKGSIARTRESRAEELADRELERVAHSMTLEAQGLPQLEIRRQRKRVAGEFLRGSSRTLWR
jgi:predicted DNA-binding mobile mystery protein A